jgi:hypothetical protein
LTFGGAHLIRLIGTNIRPYNLAKLPPLDPDVAQQIRAINKAGVEYKALVYHVVQRNIKQALKGFPKPSSLRIIYCYHPQYLGGCLTPEQRRFDEVHFGPNSFKVSRIGLTWEPSRYIASSRDGLVTTVLEACTEANAAVQDFRLSSNKFMLGFSVRSSSEDPAYITHDDPSRISHQGKNGREDRSSLVFNHCEELGLSVDDDACYPLALFDYATHFEELITAILAALRNA